MKVSQNWLKELVDINVTPDELSEKLSVGGFEVESLENSSLKYKGVVLGRVLSVKKHNNSDKLSICNVDIGKKQLQIICGAQNIKSNIFVYVATIGTFLDHLKITIKASEIRGISSEGMICSLQELGLEDKSDGIAIINDKLGEKFELGTPISNLLKLNDCIYDLAITANRPDGMSVIGVAREISALLQTKLRFPEIIDNLILEKFKPCIHNTNAINNDSFYSITSVDNVDGKILSPEWIRDRLEKSDIKSINLIVDITNYVLLEQGQPFHAFDKDKLSLIAGKDVGHDDFGIREAKDGEKLLALDGITYDLNENITVITCADIPIAIAGVIGGMDTSVSDSTNSLYLESAVFNPSSIRKSSKEIGIRTESSSRFEKGISKRNTITSIKRIIKLFSDFFKINESTTFITEDITTDTNFIKLRRTRIQSILGPIVERKIDNKNEIIHKRNLTDIEITEKLKLIGCKLISKEYGWDVQVIPHRSQDLIREIDLIEEIARLIGYDFFDQNIPNPLTPGRLTNKQKVIRNIRNYFANTGFNEVLTYSLVSNDDNKRIKISNPLLAETSCLRNNLWQEHIKIVNQNIKSGRNNCWIFEIGKIFTKEDDFREEEYLSGAISGNNEFEYWKTSGKTNDLDYYQARGKLRESLSALNINIIDKPTEKINYLHPGRSSLLLIEGKEAGYFGQIHPKFIYEKKALKTIYLFNLKVSSIIDASTRKNIWEPIFKSFPLVPKIERDINLIFNKKFLLNEIIIFIKKSGKKLLEDVSIIDIYQDKIIGVDNISYTFRLSYRDPVKTLKESDINQLNANIIQNIIKKYSAILRE